MEALIPVVVVIGGGIIVVLLWSTFVRPNLSAHCKECGWKGQKKDLLVRADFEELELCPTCRKVVA